MKKVEDMSETFDEHHFERADKFRQELVAQLKEHMLTLQACFSVETIGMEWFSR